MRDASTIIAFTIGFIILFSFEYKLVPSAQKDGQQDYIAVSDDYSLFFIDMLGYL